ncbi:RagB/SusD family nutrient uptake outer membrane protein [Pontibacter cellulosilyticus]|uniref:RagB/SusD family nutrient uptake outer membrane protein n=1 Tax=Pontibacter cellulosilyticus TaxID=1720253 RepID=A0A923NBQ5_9BACT|nr:RagB/SusD family nutrient uptake outer membrane protein [Pontibacter cellulosilyticus]MBC5994487.1 RagB/SusD family nutrient uptake outer membrane protein [Pontibacter cellulosilyticus]
MKNITSYIKIGVLSGFLLLTSSCELDIPNPNAASDIEVLNSREGLIGLSVGLRQYYSTSGIEAAYLYPGVTSRELKGVATFTNVLELEAGGTALPTFNGNILGLWSRMQRTMNISEQILENAPNVASLTGGMRSGILAQAHLFKAMALGTLAMAFEQANTETSVTEDVVFRPRQDVFAEAISHLNQGITLIEATPVSAEFKNQVTGQFFDVKNTLYAMNARFNLFAGNYQAAISNANKVDLSVKSEYDYSDLSINPIFNTIFNLKYYRPRDNFGLPASLFYEGDNREDFYLSGPIVLVDGDPVRNLAGFFDNQTERIPVYLTDEMKLIKAEAILRSNGSLVEALALINEVRTQTSGDPFGVNAGLPPYTGPITRDALLLEVYRQRSAELYLTGMRLEDSRRFGRPGPPGSFVERNRNFYPYPDQERLTNPNTPEDPAI